MRIRIQTCSFETREDTNIYSTFFNFRISTESEFFVRAFISVAFFTVSLCLRSWCRWRRSSFSSLTTATVARCYFVMTETAWVFFGTLSICLPLKTLFHLPFKRRLSFIFDSLVTDNLSTTSVRTLKFRGLIIWPTWSFTDVFNRKYLGCPLFRTVSFSYKAKTVWSLTGSRNFDLYSPFRITSEGLSLTDSRAWSHWTTKSWTSSFCKLTLNKFDSPCTASEAPVARKCA